MRQSVAQLTKQIAEVFGPIHAAITIKLKKKFRTNQKEFTHPIKSEISQVLYKINPGIFDQNCIAFSLWEWEKVKKSSILQIPSHEYLNSSSETMQDIGTLGCTAACCLPKNYVVCSIEALKLCLERCCGCAIGNFCNFVLTLEHQKKHSGWSFLSKI